MLREMLAIVGAHDLPKDDDQLPDALARGADLLVRAGVPVPDLPGWEAARRYLQEFLSSARVIGDGEASYRIAAEAQTLAEHDPWAALLPAAAVVAEWEGGSADWLFSTRDGAMNWGWHGLVLPLARVLERIPALWSAQYLTEEALGLIRWAEVRPMPAHTTETLAELRGLRDRLEVQYASLRDRLARDVWQAARVADAPIRSPLAALWWSLGDPWHAHGIRDTGFTPAFAISTQSPQKHHVSWRAFGG